MWLNSLKIDETNEIPHCENPVLPKNKAPKCSRELTRSSND